jgi:hypothetical protein
VVRELKQRDARGVVWGAVSTGRRGGAVSTGRREGWVRRYGRCVGVE